MKKYISILIPIIVLIVFICIFVLFPTKPKENTEGLIKPTDYIACDSSCKNADESVKIPFKNISFKEANEKIENKESFVLLLAHENNSWSIDLVPMLEKLANQYKEFDDILYYVNLRPDGTEESDLRNLENEDYKKFYDMVAYRLYDGILKDPTIAYIKDGEIAAIHIGVFEKWDSSEKHVPDDEIGYLESKLRWELNYLLLPSIPIQNYGEYGDYETIEISGKNNADNTLK